jgi:hypothetical protein
MGAISMRDRPHFSISASANPPGSPDAFSAKPATTYSRFAPESVLHSLHFIHFTLSDMILIDSHGIGRNSAALDMLLNINYLRSK